MESTCEMFMDYAYEGEVKIPLHVRMQNALTKLITAVRKFILKVRSLKTEHEVPRSVLDAYKSLSKMCFNCVNRCKNALQTGESPKVVFNEPFDSKEYKILFDDNYKKKASPGDYVKISSSEVLGNMNGALTALSNAKQGLRSVNGSDNPNQAAALTQIVNYTKFMLKISNRVLSYRNMYVEKRHLPTTPVNEAYVDCITEIDIAMEGIFGNLFKKKNKPKVSRTEESRKLELEIRKKVCDHLIKYSKKPSFINEYRKATCTFPDMEIKVTQNGVQIARTKDGTLDPSRWPEYIKDDYYKFKRNKNNLFDKYYNEFNIKWYGELLQEGKDWCRKNCPVPDNFILQLWDDNLAENILYIEVFEKVEAMESYADIAEEGIFSNIFKKKKESSSDMVELTAIEEVHPENPLYDQFVTISINYDPRNLFTSNKSIPNNIPKEMHNFYKQCEPENVCVSMNGNNLMFIPLREINRIQKTYSNVSKRGRFIFATVNADPVYYYDGKICTTYHSDSKVKDEMINSSFNDFLKKLILENGTKKNW